MTFRSPQSLQQQQSKVMHNTVLVHTIKTLSDSTCTYRSGQTHGAQSCSTWCQCARRKFCHRQNLQKLLQAEEQKPEETVEGFKRKLVWCELAQHHLVAVSTICLRLIIQLSGRLTIPFFTPPQAGGPLQSVMAMLSPMTQFCGVRTLVKTPIPHLTVPAQLGLHGIAYQMCQRLQPSAAIQGIPEISCMVWGSVYCSRNMYFQLCHIAA